MNWKSWGPVSVGLVALVATGAFALHAHRQADASKRELVGRDQRCRMEVAGAIRQLRSLTEERLKMSDACNRAAGAQSFEMVYWAMSACFASQGDWSSYRQHFEAALILQEPARAGRVVDGLEAALRGAQFGSVKYPSLGPAPAVPLCSKM